MDPNNPEYIKTMAEKGDPKFQNSYGMYILTFGRYKTEESVEWFVKSAIADNCDAINNLGYICEQMCYYEYKCYVNNENIARLINQLPMIGLKDDSFLKKSISLYEYAAFHAHAPALHNLGCLCLNGKVFGKNYSDAIKYFEKSSALGNIYSNYYLWKMYQCGIGVNMAGFNCIQSRIETGEEYIKKLVNNVSLDRHFIIEMMNYETNRETNPTDLEKFSFPEAFYLRGLIKKRNPRFDVKPLLMAAKHANNSKAIWDLENENNNIITHPLIEYANLNYKEFNHKFDNEERVLFLSAANKRVEDSIQKLYTNNSMKGNQIEVEKYIKLGAQTRNQQSIDSFEQTNDQSNTSKGLIFDKNFSYPAIKSTMPSFINQWEINLQYSIFCPILIIEEKMEDYFKEFASIENQLRYDSVFITPDKVFGFKIMKEEQKTTLERAFGGDGLAEYEIGMMYLSGDNLPKSDYNAYKWLLLSANHGNQYAQYEIAKMYMNLHGKYDERAREYFIYSAKSGNTDAIVKLHKLFKRRNDYKDLISEFIEKLHDEKPYYYARYSEIIKHRVESVEYYQKIIDGKIPCNEIEKQKSFYRMGCILFDIYPKKALEYFIVCNSYKSKIKIVSILKETLKDRKIHTGVALITSKVCLCLIKDLANSGHLPSLFVLANFIIRSNKTQKELMKKLKIASIRKEDFLYAASRLIRYNWPVTDIFMLCQTIYPIAKQYHRKTKDSDNKFPDIPNPFVSLQINDVLQNLKLLIDEVLKQK